MMVRNIELSYVSKVEGVCLMSDVLFPLKMVQNFKPFKDINVWEFIEEVIKERKANLLWYEKCYIPVSVLFNSLLPLCSEYNKNNIEFRNKLTGKVALSCILAHWRRFKEVYKFDSDMIELLYESSDTWENTEIPTEIFKHMPFPCFYVEQKFVFHISGIDICAPGFFVFFNEEMKKAINTNWNVKRKSDVLHLYFECENNRSVIFPFNIFNSDKVVYSINKYMNVNPNFDKDNLLQVATKAMQLVIYICSQNAEIKENPIQKKIMKRRENIISDKYREIRIWDVGERIGENIRLFEKSISSNELAPSNQGRNRPRPHVRRAHWRVYRDREGVDKDVKKVVFIHEQTINTDNPDKITAIVHNNKF